jgi:hypothetical protein
MKENALDAGILETYITCLMLACDTNDRGMIESMVKAMVAEYSPQANVHAPGNDPVTLPHPTLKKFVSYRI